MNNYTLPYFEKIDLDSKKDYYQLNVNFEGHTIQLDINIESSPVNINKLEIAKSFLENISNCNKKAKIAVVTDYENNGTVKDYIEHHLEYIDEDELEIFLKDQDKNLSKNEQLLSMVHLKRIGFYLDDDEDYAIFDYTIGTEITQYLIVVKFDSDVNIEYLTMES